MLYLYDKAIKDKLSKMFPRVIYSPVDKFYDRYLIDSGNKQSLELPAISFWRVNTHFHASNSVGQLREPAYTMKGNKAYTLKEIQSLIVDLNYQLDIWATTDRDRDDLLQELLYALTLYPDISIQYEGADWLFPLTIDDDGPEDLTDISSFEDTGDIYRVQIPFRIDMARLFFYRTVVQNRYINVSYYVDNNLDHVDEIMKKGD